MRITRQKQSLRGWLLAGWALAGGLVAVSANRLLRPETQPVLIGIQGVAVWLLAPALPLAVVAGWRRQWALTGVAALVAVAQLSWVGAAIGWHGSQPAPAGSYLLRLESANVLLQNARIADLADDLAVSGADVVLLQEVTPEILVAIEQTALWPAYPERILDPLPGFHGSAILSKLPIAAGRAIDVAGYPMTRADVVTPAGTVRIVNVHVVAPITDENTPRWRAQLDAMAQWQPPDGSGLILAGDFNSTVDHGPFQRVLAGGKRDAFLVAGSGWGTTWPQWSGPVFPVMRLDHVLISDDLTAVTLTELDSPGSDHRRLRAEIAIPAAR